jgi:hypothetical protein
MKKFALMLCIAVATCLSFSAYSHGLTKHISKPLTEFFGSVTDGSYNYDVYVASTASLPYTVTEIYVYNAQTGAFVTIIQPTGTFIDLVSPTGGYTFTGARVYTFMDGARKIRVVFNQIFQVA